MCRNIRVASPIILTLCALSWSATSLSATLNLKTLIPPNPSIPVPIPVPPDPKRPTPTPEVKVDPTNPSSPVSVKAGSVTVTPNALPVPSKVHIDGTGALVSEINKFSDVEQLPTKFLEKSLTLPFDAGKAAKSWWDQLIGFKQSAKDFINWLRHLAPKAIAVMVAALFGIVVFAVILARLVMKPFEKSPTQTPRLSK
jgi:hypothetical protein